MTNEEALVILKDFMENPDDYFAKKYPFIPMKFYSSVEVAIEALAIPVFNKNQQVLLNYIQTLPEKSLTAVMSHLSGLVLSDFSIPEAHMDVVRAYEALTTQEVLQVISKVV